MTEETAKAALVRVAERLGGRWRAVDGSARRSRAFGLRENKGFVRKRFRLEYGDDEYAMTFSHGDTWRQALDDFVQACQWWPSGEGGIPADVKAGSAEELVLKLAVAGEIPGSPDT